MINTEILVVIHFILNIYWCSAQNITTQLPPCAEVPKDTTPEEPWLEQNVIGVFKVWHIIFSGLFSGLAIVVVLCCLFRCRIPRTKQEIEADFVRRKITKVFRNHLNKIKMEELEAQPNNLIPVLQKVEKMEGHRINKQVSFEGGKLNWRQKLRAMFALEREMTGSSSIDDENLSGRFDDSEGLTEEEKDVKRQKEAERKVADEKNMKEITKTVDNAKIDSSSFNVISDHISILMGFETDKDRKKREKNEKKQKLKDQKQKEIDDKLEKKEKEKAARFEKKRKEIEEKLLKEESKSKTKKDSKQLSKESEEQIQKKFEEISIEVNGNVEEFEANYKKVNEIDVQTTEAEEMKENDEKDENISKDETHIEIEDQKENIKPKDKKLKEKEEKKQKERERKEKEKEEKRLKEEKKVRDREEKKELEERLKREKVEKEKERKLKEKEEKERKLKEKAEKSKGKGDSGKVKDEKDKKTEKKSEKDEKTDETDEKVDENEVFIQKTSEDKNMTEYEMKSTETKTIDESDRKERSKDRERKSRDRDKKEKSKERDKEVKDKGKDRESTSKPKKDSKPKEPEIKSKTREKCEKKSKESEEQRDKPKDKERVKDKERDKKSKSRERDGKESKSRDRESERKLVKQKRSAEEVIEIEGEIESTAQLDSNGNKLKIIEPIDEQTLDMDNIDKQSNTSTITSTSGWTGASAHRLSREEKTKKLVDIQRSKSRESTRSEVKIEIEDEFGIQSNTNELNNLNNNS